MPLPIPNLDDQRFDDLVADARTRLATHLPELTTITTGDPAHAFIDLFAHLTESILFRANLIPERQRRVVMNLLQIPLRNATPAKGLVCIDTGPRAVNLPNFVPDGAQFKAGSQTFTGLGEIQPTPLSLSVAIKKSLSDETLAAMGLSQQALREQYGLRNSDTPEAFEPKAFELGKENLSLTESLDKYYYLALTLPKTLRAEREALRENFAGITLNIAIAPPDNTEAFEDDEINSLSPRRLVWELLSQDEQGNILNLPLDIISDSSRGGRQMGVVRLRLPKNTALFNDLQTDDPMFAGVGDYPPELPAPITGDLIAAWLRLSCPDDPDLNLAYLGVNGLDVIGQGLKEDVVLGVGNGNPDQLINLPDNLIDPNSIVLQVEEEGAWVTWQRVDFLVGLGGSARVYRLDAVGGIVYFGDGLEGGKRPPIGKRIRIAYYLFGGGVEGNLAAGEIKELSSAGRLTIRHEVATQGGIDAETITQAERRIPQFLTHRNRAVTKQDFKTLTQNNPINPVARAEVIEGFLPGSSIRAARTDIPGAVSVFVMPPGFPVMGETPKATKGLLKDVFEYLLQRVLVGTELYVLSPEYISVAVGVNVDVLDPDTEQETTQAVQTALVNYLWSLAPGGPRGEGWGLGVSVSANELQTQVARVTGIRAVKAFSLFQKNDDGWQRLPDSTEIELTLYQLPELLGVSVGTGSGEAPVPSIVASDSGSFSSNCVPAPVIPELC
jgi:hypothetical protein